MTECVAPMRAQASMAIASFGDHRHVDRDAVARLDAELLQHVGELADFAVQILVAQHAGVARLAFPDDGGLVLAGGGQVPVEAVVAGVELAADEPLRERLVPLEHLVPGLEPVQALGGLPPRTLRDRPWPSATGARTLPAC